MTKANNFLQSISLLPSKPELSYIELPNPRDISVKFPTKTPDFGKIKEFGKILRKSHFNQLVLGKRIGEKVQLKPIQFLTDLLPPPYPPQFKYKPDIKEFNWSTFAEPHQELTTEKVIEKQKISEEKLKKMQPPRDYPSSAQSEILMPKVPTQSIIPIQTASQYSRSLPVPTQNTLNDSEKTAYAELITLLQKKDRSHDPRLQLKIEQILSEFPNLCNFLKA